VPVTQLASVDDARRALAAAPSPVVVVAAHNAYEDVVRCLDAVVAHTPRSTAVLVVEDGGADARIVDTLAGAADAVPHTVVVLRHARN
jgi:uncharacterized membrane protein